MTREGVHVLDLSLEIFGICCLMCFKFICQIHKKLYLLLYYHIAICEVNLKCLVTKIEGLQTNPKSCKLVLSNLHLIKSIQDLSSKIYGPLDLSCNSSLYLFKVINLRISFIFEFLYFVLIYYLF